jgi:SAM-dependent methyltransferase
MFSKTTKYYDAIYSFKDYGAEAASIRSIIEREHPTARSILDVACGTGEHARLLAKDFAVDGLDLEPDFVALAQSKAVRGSFSIADMRQFELGKSYDVVLCLFSSIGYLLREADVVQAFQCFSGHVADDRVVIVEPWFTPDKWETGRPWLSPPVDLPDLKICRMNVSDRRGDLSLLRFQYLIATPAGIEHVEEDHELALYTNEQLLKCFSLAGLLASHESVGLSGRGLYIARKLRKPSTGRSGRAP